MEKWRGAEKRGGGGLIREGGLFEEGGGGWGLNRGFTVLKQSQLVTE